MFDGIQTLLLKKTFQAIEYSFARLFAFLQINKKWWYMTYLMKMKLLFCYKCNINIKYIRSVILISDWTICTSQIKKRRVQRNMILYFFVLQDIP